MSDSVEFRRENASLLPDASAHLVDPWLSRAEALALFERLRDEIAWSSSTIKMFGREVSEPRLTAYYGDEDAVYTYSGRTNVPLAWTDDLASLRARAEAASGWRFNSVLLNLYRDGRDSMGFHSDDERELGADPHIASVSLGGTRKLVFAHRTKKLEKLAVSLRGGSLLLMGENVQRLYRHAVPKTSLNDARINLTFRSVQRARVGES